MPITKVDPKILEVVKTYAAYIKQEYQERLDCVVLFGSQARGEARGIDSDVDVLIVLHDPMESTWEEIERTGYFTAEFSLDHDLLISRLFLLSSRFHNENSSLLRNIRKDGIIL